MIDFRHANAEDLAAIKSLGMRQSRGPMSVLKMKIQSMFRSRQQPKSVLAEIQAIDRIVSPLHSPVESLQYFPIGCAPPTPTKGKCRRETSESKEKAREITASRIKEKAQEITGSPVNEKAKQLTLAGPGTNKTPVRSPVVRVRQTSSIAKILHDMHLRKEQAKAKAILAMQPRERPPVVLSEAGGLERARQMVLNEMAFGTPVLLVAF
jgi:hypothetical protein